MTGTLDVDAYLRRIDFDGAPAPTRASLDRLVERHARTIPFENIEVLAKRVPRLDLDGLQDKLVRQRRGGYCFEQNTLFRAVLRAVGFEVAPMEARIRSGVPADIVTARTHLVIRVALDGEALLADVGCGTIAPMASIGLARRDEQAAGTGFYRFVDVGDELLLQQREAAGWKDCYQLLPRHPHAIDGEMGNWFVATHPNSMLGKNLLVGRAIDGGRLRLFNRRLSTFTPECAEPVERELQTRAEFADVLADGFGLDIAPADLDAVMAAIDRLPTA